MGLLAALNSAQAEVMDIAPDGTVTMLAQTSMKAARGADISPTVRRTQIPDGKISGLLASAADHYALDPNLLNAVAWNESRYQHDAVSPKGAVGVMQLMDGTARALGVNRYDLSQNILGGAAYLKQMMLRYGDPALALAAYNAGPGAVDRYGAIPPFQETRNYVRAILGGVAPPIQSPPQFVLSLDH